jgi:outer membrane protein OmpA-like peptidoglycan-associated protein
MNSHRKWTGALLAALATAGCSTFRDSARFAADVDVPEQVGGRGLEIAWWERVTPPPEPQPRQVVACDMPSDILFESGSATIGEAGRRKLESFAPSLAAALSIELGGHTDRTPRPGTPEEPDGNLALSRDRAQAAADIFVSAGVPESIITTRGWGASRPTVDETTGDESHRAEARQANRRVELRALFPTGSAPPDLCPAP